MPAWYRQLGLEQDPFAESAPFFPGGGRRQLVQQMVQQLHFGSGGVALLGERGTGVSALLQAVLDALQGVADTRQVTAAELVEGGLWPVLAPLLGAGPRPAPDEEEAALVRAWQQLQPADGEALPLLLAIDRAEELEDELLAAVLRLRQATRGGLRLLLGGAPELLQRLPAAGAEWLCLRLEPLDADSLADYVLTRLQAAGYSGSQPLTPLQLELLREHSGGLPAAVPAVLERVLKLPRASLSQRLSGLPGRHIVLVAALLTAVAVSWLYRQGESAPPAEQARPSAEPAPPALAEGLPAQVEPLAVAAPPRRVQRVALPEERARSEGAPATPEVVRAPSPPPERAEAEKAKADEQQVLAAPASSHWLQLFGTREAGRAARQAAEAGIRVHVIELRLEGRPWFIGLSGPYDSQAQARAAIAELPAELRRGQPWPRSQRELAAALRARQAEGERP